MTAASKEDFPEAMRVIDSHTEGEPTRVVYEGWPAPQGDTMAERRAWLLQHQDHLRRASILEPRGHEAVVGALLTSPVTPSATAGVIFFNNAGGLGMCGHGLIGVIRTLQYLGRISTGITTIDTPVGVVSAQLHDNGEVTIRNVPSYCHLRGVRVHVDGLGDVVGDVAYGGNWFFITHVASQPIAMERLATLNDVTMRIRRALERDGITGAGGAEIDHIEMYEALESHGRHGARNFVMCPGGAYDRSPCGTGTSAKLAALHAAGELGEREEFVQESITGGTFTAWLERDGDQLVPHIRGRAFITAESILRFDPADPFVSGFGGAP